MADQINLREFADHSEFKSLPVLSPEQASWSIAQQVLWIFAGVLFLSFVFLLGLLIWSSDAKFDKAIEVLKFLVQSVIPLVTLAVGYYLGDRTSKQRLNEAEGET